MRNTYVLVSLGFYESIIIYLINLVWHSGEPMNIVFTYLDKLEFSMKCVHTFMGLDLAHQMGSS